MNATPEILTNVERMAAAAFSAEEIAEVMELPEEELKSAILMPGSVWRKAYNTGYLRRQLELRERIFKDAKNGSSPAQTIAHKLLEDVAIKNAML